jgi:fumarate reductase subunit C
MGGWWRRDPFFVRYMIREATAVPVVAYAVVLLVGLVRLAQGEAAYDAWLAAQRTPLALIFYVVLLAGFLHHSFTWFEIMPKTVPMIVVRGKKLGPRVITGAGLGAAVAACLLLLLLAREFAR